MFDSADLPKNIAQDYRMVIEYSHEAATVIDKSLRPKSFAFHVPHKHKIAGAPTWDRNTWGLFDSLPKSFRIMVNEDPGNVDENLAAALDTWKEMTIQAEKAMDRIIGYEQAATRHGLNLPDWLMQTKTEELSVIQQLKAEREAEAARLAADRKEAEAEAERRRKEYMDRERRFGGSYRTVTANNGAPLNKVEVVDISGLPPHIAREVLAQATPLKFEYRHYQAPVVKRAMTEDESNKLDSTPPAKVHPVHFKRGRNF